MGNGRCIAGLLSKIMPGGGAAGHRRIKIRYEI